MARAARALGIVSIATIAALVPGFSAERAARAQSVEAAPPALASTHPGVDRVVALGRLEPKDEVIRVAGPSLPAVVIAELRVDEGDWVEKDDIIAVLDTYILQAATVARHASRAAKRRGGAQAARGAI